MEMLPEVWIFLNAVPGSMLLSRWYPTSASYQYWNPSHAIRWLKLTIFEILLHWSIRVVWSSQVRVLLSRIVVASDLARHDCDAVSPVVLLMVCSTRSLGLLFQTNGESKLQMAHKQDETGRQNKGELSIFIITT